MLIEKKPRLIAAAVAGGVALGFMAIGEVLVAMRDGFSGEGNTNGATLSSGGHIGIGGKHMGGLSTVVHWDIYHSVLTPYICHFLYANIVFERVCQKMRNNNFLTTKELKLPCGIMLSWLLYLCMVLGMVFLEFNMAMVYFHKSCSFGIGDGAQYEKFRWLKFCTSA